jgi:hypothetical protein
LREGDKCECEAAETVVQVLIDCPKLKDRRQKFRKRIGAAFNDILRYAGRRIER